METVHVSLDEFKAFLAERKDFVFDMSQPDYRVDNCCALVEFGKAKGSIECGATFVAVMCLDLEKHFTVESLPDDWAASYVWPNDYYTGQQILDTFV